MVTGTLEAENERAAATQLKQSGFYPLSIIKAREGATLSQGLSWRLLKRIGSQDIAVFSRRLATLVAAGIPLSRSLTTLAEQTENSRLAGVIKDVRDRVQAGSTFSESLSRFPGVFPALFVTMVHAGETGGMLQEVLERLANHYEGAEVLRGKVKSALVYPSFLVIVGIGTIFVLLTFVIPRFVSLFRDLGQVLPLPTRILIQVSGFMGHFWWLVIGVLFLLIFAVKRFKKTKSGKRICDRAALRIPLAGSVIRKLETANFSRTLGALLESGVSILQALEVVGKSIRNQEIADAVLSARQDVAEGAPLAPCLERSGHFSPMVINMVATGEESGALPLMLRKVAEAYDQEVDRAVSAMTRLLEPAMILILGGGVGFIVMSILLPIFRLNVLIR